MVHQLLKDFQVDVSTPALLFCDNKAAIHISTNPTFHERTKHIEIDYPFVREKLAAGFIKLMPIRYQHQLADIFTKALPSSLLKSLLSKMTVKAIYSSFISSICFYRKKEIIFFFTKYVYKSFELDQLKIKSRCLVSSQALPTQNLGWLLMSSSRLKLERVI